LASTAVVPKRAVQDLMSQHSFKFCRLERIDEGGIVNDAPAIRRHRGYGARHELQPKTQSPEEWLVQEKLVRARVSLCWRLFVLLISILFN